MSNAPRKRTTKRTTHADFDAALIYGRISESKDLATARQVKACRGLCDARGVPVARVFLDEGVSAWNGATRPEFDAMLDHAAELTAQGRRVLIVAWDLDRLVRRVAEVGRLIDLYEEHAVPFVTVQGGVDLTSAAGKLIAYILTAVAEMESEHKAERLRLRFAQDREAGRPHWSYRPFGFELDGTHREEEAAILRELYKRFLDGESLRALVLWLHAEGVQLPERKDRKSGKVTPGTFTVSALRKLLRAERNAGLYKSTVTDEAPSAGAWAPIVDVETFTRAARVLDTRATGSGANRRHLLSGFLRCEACGGRLESAVRKEGDIYRCRKDTAVNQHGCGRSVSMPTVNGLVRDAVLAWLADPANREHLTVPADLPDVGAIHDEIARATERKRALIAMTKDNALGVDLDDIGPELRAIAATIEEARAKLSKVAAASPVEKLPTDPATLRAGWDELDIDDQRALVADVLEPVTIRPVTKCTGRNFDPTRVVISYRYPTAA